MAIDIMWSLQESPGIEHLHLEQADDGVTANGLVLGLLDDQPVRLRYRVQTDARWIARRLDVVMRLPGAHELSLSADEAGHWTLPAGEPLPDLDGCLFVDIMATPFTNTLPIRHLGLREGQSTEIDVAYVRVPDLNVSHAPQRYTCLRQEPGGAVYRYESLSSGFTADITVDDDGLVVEYPGIWRRVWSHDDRSMLYEEHS